MKYKLLFIALFLGSTIIAQGLEMIINQGHVPAKNINFEVEDPCSRMNPGNNFEVASSMSSGTAQQLIANDIFVQPNENFNLDQVIINIWTGGENGMTAVDVNVWSDQGGLPNEMIYSEINIVPAAQNFLMIVNGGIFVNETIIDLPTPFLLEGGTTGAAYWIQVVGHPADNSAAAWEGTSASFVGFPLAFNHSGTWEISETYDGMYIFNGECESLRVDAQQLENISLFPNPVKDFLKLQLPVNVNIKSVILHNSLGQKLVSLTDNFQSIDMANYAAGLYIVTVVTETGSISKKVIKI